MKSGKLSLISKYLIELDLFRLFFLFSLLTFYPVIIFSQTTPVSGIVNTYYPVIDIVPAKACVLVPNAAGLSHNDKVMLIQMKGAGINTSNSSSFGDTTSLNDAGNYEIATVCHVDNDSVFMVFMLLNHYTIAGKVQLVKIPEYVSAIVVDTLKAAPWNNAAGTGGVLAISVEQDLTLNAPIFADSSGFKGGEYSVSSGDCTNIFPATDYVYNASLLGPQNGSFKGEGIADVATGQSGGRGAPANGGGGGNNHNNAGGGGANLSKGGDGGGNSSSAGCRTSIQGKAGKALSSYSGAKIFAGGGGGAGHVNNGIINPVGGGNGGGIIFIEATTLIGNGEKISANGQRGGSANGDGGNGGGAGGTLILDILNYTGTVTIASNGGQGGTVNDQGTAGRCYGGGGGGSGGAIYFKAAVPAVTVTTNAGNGGTEISRSAACNAAVPGLAGSAGQVVSSYTYSNSLILESSYCALLLPVHLVSFKAAYRNGRVELAWKIAQSETAERFIVERSTDGYNWIVISQQPAFENISDYKEIDLSPDPQTNFYRLKMFDKNNVMDYSPIQKIFIPLPGDLIKIYPNPTRKKIIITGILPALADGISLHDLSGKLLWQKKVNTNQTRVELDLPDLPNGMYMLKIGNSFKKIAIH